MHPYPTWERATDTTRTNERPEFMPVVVAPERLRASVAMGPHGDKALTTSTQEQCPSRPYRTGGRLMHLLFSQRPSAHNRPSQLVSHDVLECRSLRLKLSSGWFRVEFLGYTVEGTTDPVHGSAASKFSFRWCEQSILLTLIL